MGAKCFGSAAASLLEPAAGKQREEAFTISATRYIRYIRELNQIRSGL
jgi:hypothetical protein